MLKKIFNMEQKITLEYSDDFTFLITFELKIPNKLYFNGVSEETYWNAVDYDKVNIYLVDQRNEDRDINVTEIVSSQIHGMVNDKIMEFRREFINKKLGYDG